MPTYAAVILVGGPSRGTRFRPLSLDTPKPLFPIAGKPVIYHHLKALSKVEGLNEVYLIGSFEDSVLRAFTQQVSREFAGLTVRYLREFTALGTAGGIYHFRDQILRSSPDRLFVLHADVACTFPLTPMTRFHRDHEGWCTILSTKVPREAAHNFGCLVQNPTTHEVLHYVEKPESFISDLISCGVYLFDVSVFAEIAKALERRRNPSVPTVFKDEMEEELALDYASGSGGSGAADILRLEQDILWPLAGDKRIFAFETTDPWRQIKTAGSSVPANALYLQLYAKTSQDLLSPPGNEGGPEIVGPVIIHPTAMVDPSAKIGPNVTIGAGVIIGRGVRVRESIILDNVEIRSNACILYCVIGWDSRVGRWCRVEGTPAPAYDTKITDNGVKVESSSILGNQVTIADETIIRNCIVLPNKELKASFKNEILM
ncbi:MAG: mannose-1-phosphate guanyltransferase [Piptocephalis tieghemiana]|nr:MAG: mannose-1-phosphate guanyltransferase [Piptocephalis tieghemiana]